MAETYWDSWTSGLSGVFDSISTGVKTFYDGKIAVNQAQANLALSESQKNNAETINDISRGQGAISWNTPTASSIVSDPLNPQNLMVLGAVALIVYAIARK
jgi:hypothetical protein